ncbi:MAG: rhomboid family intramembrane serine protease [Bacteroidia bacterium]
MSEFEYLFSSPVSATILTITLITSIRAFSDPELKARFIFNPVRILRGREFQRLFTSGLIHGSVMHLAFNMLAFYFFAFPLERILGHWQFAMLYMASLAISDIPSLIRYRDQEGYNSLGASGAVSAIVFSVILFDPEIGIGLIFIPGYIPGWLFAILYIAFSFFASFRGGGNINHDAHIWGALSGIVLTVLLEPGVVRSFNEWMSTAF